MSAARNIEINSEEQAYAILDAVHRLAQPPIDVVDYNFKKQAAFVCDDSPRVSGLCTRRAGKSYGVGLKLYRAALRHPGSSSLYLALTRDSARNIMWKDVMKTINRTVGLGAGFNETLLETRLPNGSDIKLAGADASKEEMEKFLGGKYPIVVLDEAGSYRQDTQKLIYENLEPAVADYDGQVCTIGTPTALTKGLFFNTTRPEIAKREKGWSVHQWSTFDNPYMEKNWRKRIDAMIATNPRVVETPAYRRMYLGEWVTDETDLVYKFNEDRNKILSLPPSTYLYVLGVDLGFNPDPSAFVVGAYSLTDKNLYFIEAFKKLEMDLTDVAEKIKHYQKKYPIHTVVVDNAAKQAVEEIKNRHGLDLQAADKTGKADFIEIMNSEMITGLVRLVGDNCKDLEEEWSNLIWDERETKRQEHPNCANHLSDAALYCWRRCYQYLSQAAVSTKKTAEEMIEDWVEKEDDLLEKNKNLAFWEREF